MKNIIAGIILLITLPSSYSQLYDRSYHNYYNENTRKVNEVFIGTGKTAEQARLSAWLSSGSRAVINSTCEIRKIGPDSYIATMNTVSVQSSSVRY